MEYVLSDGKDRIIGLKPMVQKIATENLHINVEAIEKKETI